MAEPTIPGPGPTIPGPGQSTSDAALSDLQNRSHAVNEQTQKAARRLRAAPEKTAFARRRKWDRH